MSGFSIMNESTKGGVVGEPQVPYKRRFPDYFAS